jgi:spermidine/putrescine transport system permease protein
VATVEATLAPRSARTSGTGKGAFGILFAPVTLLIVLFLAPMVIMGAMSVLRFPPNTASGRTFSHYTDVLTNPLNWKIAWTTLWIGTTAMLIMLANAWQVILGRNGIVNWLIPGPPKTWLLFSPFAVIVTLAASYITYTTIPIYAAMKAIDASMFESAIDLGAGWWVQSRRILIPLAAPGIFIAMILVYIPMLTDFVTADIVGGTGSYMMGQRVRDLILGAGDWGAGSALNLVLLALSIAFSLLAYRLARLNRIQT